MKISILNSLAIAAALSLAGAQLSSLQAAPTARVKSGATSLQLSGSFTTALTALGITAAPVKPAVAFGVPGAQTMQFSIPGGRIDLANAHGDILHVGGIRLTGSATSVEMSNFIIDTTSTPVITGVVVVNANVIGRLPLFDVVVPATLPLTPTPAGKIVLSPAPVTLGATAAASLNAAFGSVGFVAGFPIGTAKVTLKTK